MAKGEKENPAAHLCTPTRAANRRIVRYRASDPHVSKDSLSDGAEEVCDWMCVWWIPGRNAVAFDHFNHFLLYL